MHQYEANTEEDYLTSLKERKIYPAGTIFTDKRGGSKAIQHCPTLCPKVSQMMGGGGIYSRETK